MRLTRAHARWTGVVAIVGVVLLHTSVGLGCYRQDLGMFIMGALYFLGIPLLPAVFSLFRANPLGAVSACLMVAPWILFAYYIDCVKPYTGGGASLAYVAVVLYGTPGAIIGALVTPWLARKAGLYVID